MIPGRPALTPEDTELVHGTRNIWSDFAVRNCNSAHETLLSKLNANLNPPLFAGPRVPPNVTLSPLSYMATYSLVAEFRLGYQRGM